MLPANLRVWTQILLSRLHEIHVTLSPCFAIGERVLSEKRSLPQRSTRNLIEIEVQIISKEFLVSYAEVTLWCFIKVDTAHPEKQMHGSAAFSVLSL